MEEQFIEKSFGVFSSLFRNVDSLAVAVSGGADSLALCILLKQWADKNNKKITALTVDHQLRKESKEEALTVSSWMKKFGIDHHILTWNHDGIESKLQEQARLNRYQLMTDFCKKNHIRVLTTGHHANDQFETFMMRITKGSGPEGLCCMKQLIEMDTILLARPFLDFISSDMKDYLKSINQDYITDPSNDDDRFERIRWRNFSKEFMNDEHIMDHFSKSIKKLQALMAWVDETVDDAYRDVILDENEEQITLCLPSFIQLDCEISARLMGKLLKSMSTKYYSTASYERVLEIINECHQNSFKAVSIGGCIITKKRTTLEITKDPRIKL